MTREKSMILTLLALPLIMALSFIHPYDHTTWFMEVAPIFIALPVMIAGGNYTSARVPLDAWL